MFRVDTPTAIAVMPPLKAAGTPGYFTEGGAGQSPTVPGADWFNMMQEEVMGVLAAAGVAPDKAKVNQLVAAISRLAGRGVTTVTSADSPKTLTVAEAGLVLVDASAGAVTLNLPAAVGNGGLGYTLVRVDASGNAVTVTPNDTDAIEGAADLILAGSKRAALASNGSAEWKLTVAPTATDAEAQSMTNTLRGLTPASLNSALKGGNQNLAANGYQKLPGGLIIQWGTVVTSGGGGVTVIFPFAFPSACIYSDAGDDQTSTSDVEVSGTGNTSNTSLTIVSAVHSGSIWTTPSVTVKWLAIGY